MMVVVHDLAAGEQVAGSGQGSGAGDPRMTARCLSKKSLFLPVSLPDRQQWLWEGTPKSRTFLRVKFGAQSVAVLPHNGIY